MRASLVGDVAAPSPVEALEDHLCALDKREAVVQAFVALDVDGARQGASASAERHREGRPSSPIDGMVLGIKDVIETADMPTGQGVPQLSGTRTGRDAAAVQALREAGAIILGKTTTTELAASHMFFKTTNPSDPDRTPGGSSSGSAAAVAAGMVRAALGTQVVGSILRPASYCGVVGYKPTFGTLNRGGCNDQLSQSCLGILAVTLRDAWAVANTIAAGVGGDPGLPTLEGEADLPATAAPARLAVLETAGWSVADPAALALFEAELHALGDRGVEVVRKSEHAGLTEFEEAINEALHITQTILAWEFIWPLRTYPADWLSGSMGARIVAGQRMQLREYNAALKRRGDIRELFQTLCVEFDGFIALSATGPAPKGLTATGNPAMNVAASLLGTPALSLPVLTLESMPLGVQLIGKAGRDADLFALARWFLEG